jgi:O-antigen biosynthesis protein
MHAELPRLKARHPGLKVVDTLFNAVGHTAGNRKFAEFIDLTIVENGEVSAWLAAAGERPERVALVPSGVDLTLHAPAPRSPELMAQLGFGPDAFVVGYCGRLAEEKAPLSFVDIAAAAPADGRLRFFMTGGGPLEGAVRKRLASARLGARLRFEGIVPDVSAYMGLCDAFVLPSAVDGRPVAVMEALAMGIPVVASRVGGLPELVVDGETGFLCEPGDVAAFAARLGELCADRRRHALMRKAARAFAERHLDVAVMNARYAAALDAVWSKDAATTKAAAA